MRNGWSAAALSFRSGPGAQHTALQVHCNCSCLRCSGGWKLGKGPDGKLRTACAVIPHLQAIGPLQSRVCLLLCLMHPPLPEREFVNYRSFGRYFFSRTPSPSDMMPISRHEKNISS